MLASARRYQFDIRLNQLLHRPRLPSSTVEKNDANILQHPEILLVETIKSTILGVL
jgi:hypothetical protein